MSQRLEVETPESVEIAYEIAGLGSRFLAAIIDTFCIFCYLWAVVYVVFIVAAAALVIGAGTFASDLALALAIFLVFLTIWGYYILLETIWDGQTIGKRTLKIRVVKATGYPIGFMEAFIRNMVRFVDFLPTLYGVGAVSMFASRQSRRLGDYAAGTVVIKERRPVKLSDVRALGLEPAVGQAVTASSEAALGIELPRPRPHDLGHVDPDELEWDVRALLPADMQVLRAYLEREPALPPDARKRVGGDIASRVARKIGAREPLDPGQFLGRVLYLYEHG
jgi:uncharacterized RDD family membrane protein YckC